MPFETIRYLEWAKQNGGTRRYSLAGSFVPPLAREEIGLTLDAVPLVGTDGYGDRRLVAAIAARYRVAAESVLACGGTSLANFLICAALLRPGDRVLVEEPGYEPLWRAPEALGAVVARVPRPEASGFRLDPGGVRRAWDERTRLLVVSNLHNPSGAALGPDDLAALAAIAKERDGFVLCDEVYREFHPDAERAAPVGFSVSPRIISTTSPTKVHGLPGLRVGWAFAPPDVVHRAYRAYDYLAVENARPSDGILLHALSRWEDLLRRSRGIAARNARVVAEWLAVRPDVRMTLPPGGVHGVLRLPAGVSDRALFERLRDAHDTLVTPGEFFSLPGCIRLGFGQASADDLREGLYRLGLAIDEVRGGASTEGPAAAASLGRAAL